MKKELINSSKKKNVVLNECMIEKQGLSEDEIRVIQELHLERLILISTMEDCIQSDKDKLRELADKITDLDFQLQDAWHFPKSSDWHKFWELPYCSCPKLDNEETYGFKYNYKSDSCILHGAWN